MTQAEETEDSQQGEVGLCKVNYEGNFTSSHEILINDIIRHADSLSVRPAAAWSVSGWSVLSTVYSSVGAKLQHLQMKN